MANGIRARGSRARGIPGLAVPPRPAEQATSGQGVNGLAIGATQKEEAVELLHQARFDPDRAVAAQAELALAALEGGDREAILASYGIVRPDAQELVRATLEAEDPEVRFRALVKLGRNYRHQEFSTLVAAANDVAPKVRHLAIGFLSEMARERLLSYEPIGEQWVAVFAKAARDPVPEIREMAAGVYGELARR